MNNVLIAVFLLALVSAVNPKPQELIGGINPGVAGEWKEGPVVEGYEEGDEVPQCGTYQSICHDRLLASIRYNLTIAGYENGYPSYVMLNVTYYPNRSCSGNFQLFHLSYTWYISRIYNHMQDWDVIGNNLFIKVLSEDVANSVRCENGDLEVSNEVLGVNDLHCLDIGRNGIMYNYNRHFNKTKHIRILKGEEGFLTIKQSIDIDGFRIFGALDNALGISPLSEDTEFERVESFGCCEKDVEGKKSKLLWVLVTIGVVVVVVVVVAVVALLVIRSRRSSKKSLPTKKTTASTVAAPPVPPKA